MFSAISDSYGYLGLLSELNSTSANQAEAYYRKALSIRLPNNSIAGPALCAIFDQRGESESESF